MAIGRVGGTLPEDQGTGGEGVRRPEFSGPRSVTK